MAVVAATASGCGGGKATTSATSRSGPSTTLSPETATTTPDSAVPWITTKVSETDVELKPPIIPAVDPRSPLCQSDQLKPAGVFSWVTKGDIEPGDRVRFDKVWGVVEVANVTARTCRLAGQPSVTITADPGFSVTSERGGINDQAAGRQVEMPPGEPADLRIDWAPPVCDAPTANQTINVDLPRGRGRISVKVPTPATPHCLQGDAAHGLESAVSVGTFSSVRHSVIPPTPALVALKAAAILPATIALGRPLTFEIALTNPTPAPVALDPCPAYVQEFVQAGDSRHPAVNTGTLYRLNCVPRPTIEPGETVRFVMNAELPGYVRAGELYVAWRIVLPGIGDTPHTGGKTTFVQ